LNTPALRLSKTQRLRSPEDFRQVYQSKQFGVSTHHSFNVLSGGGSSRIKQPEAVSRIGITVSKKVSKKAVVRNLLKRQIKEFFRAHQNQLRAADLVITARPSCANASRAEREQSLQQLWGKVLKWQRWRDAVSAQNEASD